VAQNLIDLGTLLYMNGEYAAALPKLEEALPIKVKQHGNSHKDIARLHSKVSFKSLR